MILQGQKMLERYILKALKNGGRTCHRLKTYIYCRYEANYPSGRISYTLQRLKKDNLVSNDKHYWKLRNK